MFAVATDGTVQDIGDRFVGAEAVADEIVKRLMSNELSVDDGNYVRDIAKFGAVYWRTMIFGGSNPLGLDVVARPDGSLHIELQNCCGQRIWQTDLRPTAA